MKRKFTKYPSTYISCGSTIGHSQFEGDSSITSYDFSDVDYIKSYAFSQSKLEIADLSNVRYIGSNAFSECRNLRKVILSPDCEIGPFAFDDCINLTGTIVITPQTKLHVGAFNNCKNLTIDWKSEDRDYELSGIKALICPDNCKQLYEANEGYVDIYYGKAKKLVKESDFEKPKTTSQDPNADMYISDADFEALMLKFCRYVANKVDTSGTDDEIAQQLYDLVDNQCYHLAPEDITVFRDLVSTGKVDPYFTNI